MNKFYEEPKVEVINLDTADVIRTSLIIDDNTPDQEL